MAIKLKLSQFSDISASILTNSDKLPILQYNGSDYANKTITIETLKDELFRDGGVFIVGDSYITGNLFISGSLVSERIISSSTVDIGDNIILLNTLSGSPKRYAGIEVIDSGSSPNISSSFLWDSQNNYWILTSLSSSNLILTNITASNISASGTITASNILITGETNIPIGTPQDTLYSDGFFDTFTSQTKLANAIDEISEAFLDLAPPKAGTLTNTNLTASGMTFYSAKLAGNLNSEWYSGSYVAGSTTSIITSNNVRLHSFGYNDTPSASYFRSGKYSDFTALFGGVTGSGVKGNASINLNSGNKVNLLNSTASKVSSSNSIGSGTNPTLFIDGTRRYNTFWTQTSASLSASLTDTGSYSFQMSADNGAGSSSIYTVWYPGTYNSPSLSGVSASVDSPDTNVKYLSGIKYLSGSHTVRTYLTASNLHDPVYSTVNPLTITSGNPTNWISSISTGSATTPNWNDVLKIETNTTDNTSANIYSTHGILPQITVTATKPGKSDVTSTVTGSPYPINNYGNPAAGTTDNSTYILDNFLDEYYRYTNLQTSTFASSSTLTSITNPYQLQVQNGRLIAGATGSYSSFTSGSSNDGYAHYFRKITLPGQVSAGSLTMSLFGFTTISEWGGSTGTGPEVAMIKVGDVTDTGSANTIYDFGRAAGYSSEGIKGIQNLGNSTPSSGRIDWSLGTENTGTNLILWIKYKNAGGNYLDDFIFKT